MLFESLVDAVESLNHHFNL